MYLNHTVRGWLVFGRFVFLGCILGLLTNLEAQVAAPARVRVIKKIACVPAGADCSSIPALSYRGVKIGFIGDTQLPAFCYQITITNFSDFTIEQIQVTDDKLDLNACNFPNLL